ncbi:hypothetical protein [Yinghuangia soli]|uniref:Uncharacterized protein n=1 Tax=Yinghuangia soli TaxID=2908204 RepID=A0AA41QA16_9ACTN|nr:hypothetical protein [Yinghuangia soli]MCF2534022.1 hypothetical protein [Yinghuangia soli]
MRRHPNHPRSPERPATGRPRRGSRSAVFRALVPALLGVLVLIGLPAGAGAAPASSPASAPVLAAADPDAAKITLEPAAVKLDQFLKVQGTGWIPGSLVQVAVCGQNALGGSNTCAQTASTSITVAADGSMSARIKVTAPPKPCPCVVRAVTVTGGVLERNTPIEIEGAAMAPLPANVLTPGRLVFIDSWMAGKDTVFTWFGSPVTRRFEISVANMGQSPIVKPTFKIGTYEGVYAARWREVAWNGTIAPGAKAVISLDLELKPRQHGRFVYRVMYGDQVVDEQALNVKRPWGVYLFFALLVVVVPLTVWRLGSSVVHAVRLHRDERAAERDREVGVPLGMSDALGAKADEAGKAGRPAAAAEQPAGVLVAAGAPRLGGGVPLRSVDETVVVSGPLFAGPPTGHPEPYGTLSAPDLAPRALEAGPAADAAPAGPPEPADGAADPGSAARRLVRPDDVARGLAWNPSDGE